jgi:hypothetical protein
MEAPNFTVRVSSELLTELSQWSAPVQVRVVQLDNGEYDMIARTVQPCACTEHTQSDADPLGRGEHSE